MREPGLPEGVGDIAFSDVSDADWCCGYIETAVSYGMMASYPGGTFRSSDTITREQAMTVVTRAMDIMKLDAVLSNYESSFLLSIYPDVTQVSIFKSLLVYCANNNTEWINNHIVYLEVNYS